MFREILYALARPFDRWLSQKVGGKMLSAGVMAPDFTVSTHEGKTISLKDFRGKKIVLWFFPKADTPG